VRLVLGQDIARGQLVLRPALQPDHALTAAETLVKAP
jgi:hypothetical protein